jgi:hypothetical protein
VDLLAVGDITNRGRRIKVLNAQINRDALTGPLANQPLDALSSEILAGNIYINIHTQQNPSGELRGQLAVR